MFPPMHSAFKWGLARTEGNKAAANGFTWRSLGSRKVKPQDRLLRCPIPGNRMNKPTGPGPFHLSKKCRMPRISIRFAASVGAARSHRRHWPGFFSRIPTASLKTACCLWLVPTRNSFLTCSRVFHWPGLPSNAMIEWPATVIPLIWAFGLRKFFPNRNPLLVLEVAHFVQSSSRNFHFCRAFLGQEVYLWCLIWHIFAHRILWKS